jgi:predicted aldo/keto reductase-like oxidoreductase
LLHLLSTSLTRLNSLNIVRQARQQEAIKRQQQIEERKNQDAMEEYRLRFAAAKKEVTTLPSGKKIQEDVAAMAEATKEIADEIEFIEVSSILSPRSKC